MQTFLFSTKYNYNITTVWIQVVEILDNEAAKWAWLASRADEYIAEGKVLIFVLSKAGVEEVAASLRRYAMTSHHITTHHIKSYHITSHCFTFPSLIVFANYSNQCECSIHQQIR